MNPQKVKHLSKNTFKDYKKKVKALSTFFGDMPLCKINLDNINAYQRDRLDGEGFTKKLGKEIVKSPAGALKINTEIALLIRIMKQGLASVPQHNPWEQLAPDPLMAEFYGNLTCIEQFYIPYQVIENDIPRALSPDEQEHFLRIASSRPDWHPVWWYALVALDLTFSSDEMRTIRQGDINLTYRIVGVNRRYGKNKFRRREIPIADGACMWAIERLMERAKKMGGEAPHFHLFPARITRNVFDGSTHMSETGLRRPFEEIREKAGLPWFRMNGWRHTAITRYAEAGVPIATIMERAGHTSPKMSQHYTHISGQAQRLAVSSAFNKKPVVSISASQLRQQVSGF